MNSRNRKVMMMLAGWGLLLLSLMLSLVLLGINITLIASAFHEHEYSPPPPRYIPLPITGWLAWLLWLGPLMAVLLIAASSLVDRVPASTEKQATSKAQSEPESNAQVPPRPTWQRGACSLRLVLLLLASLAQFLVFTNASAFDTSGTLYINDVVMVSRQEAWATGFFDYNVGGYRSVLWHYSAGQSAQVDGPNVSDLTVSPNGEVWGTGDAGWLEHEQGGSWTQVSSGTTDPLDAIAMRTPTDGWAVGGFNHIPIAAESGGTEAAVFRPLALPGASSYPYTDCRIVHDVAGAWSPVPCPVTSILRSVSVLADGSAWAVGDLGTILHEIAGNWVSVPSPTRSNLRSVAMVSINEGWAVGDWGTILHYIHGAWQLLPKQTTSFLNQVDMVSPNEGWIVGEEGTLFHYVRGNWQKITWPGGPSLSGIALLPGDATDGWIVGADANSQPRIWQKQGAGWHPFSF